MMGTKVELVLSKAEIGSWAKLEEPRAPPKPKEDVASAANGRQEQEDDEDAVDTVDLDDLDLSGPKLVLSDLASGGPSQVP